jgi:hypothetical protein
MTGLKKTFFQAIKNHLKNLIVTLGRNMTPQQQEAIDVTVAVIANDNVELVPISSMSPLEPKSSWTNLFPKILNNFSSTENQPFNGSENTKAV